MDAIRFEYMRDPTGKVRTLVSWRETGKYIEGVDAADRRFKTFRKDLIARYLDGAEDLLGDPFPERASLPQKRKTAAPQILFTGFPSAQRAALEAKAVEAGLGICKSVTQACLYVVGGPNAGPTKVRKAREKGAYILDERQFHALLTTGELPESEEEAELVTDC